MINKKIFKSCFAILSFLGTVGLMTNRSALALPSYFKLPTSLAVQAATTAVETCKNQGYEVTATVVNAEGRIQAVVRGDEATPHTIENSFNKAYSVVTLGPVQKVDSTEAIRKSMVPNPFPIGDLSLPPVPLAGLTFNPGGLAIRYDSKIIAGLGVSGAPAGTVDQGCAQKGIDKIQAELAK